MQQPNLTQEQIDAVADENSKIYSREIFKTTWAARSKSIWAGGMLGTVIGGVIGAVTALSTLAVGVSLAAVGSFILPVVAAFAVAGMMTGVGALTQANSAAGAAAGIEKENDRKRLATSPAAGLQESMAYQQASQQQDPKSAVPFSRGSKKVFSPRVATIFALGGLALAALLIATGPLAMTVIGSIATPVTSAITAAVGKVAAAALIPKALTCMTLAAGALFGTLFGVDMATISANANSFIGRLFSGNAAHHARERAQSEAMAQIPLMQPPAVSTVTQITPEEAAVLNARIAANPAKNFTQAIQQTTMTSVNLN